MYYRVAILLHSKTPLNACNFIPRQKLRECPYGFKEFPTLSDVLTCVSEIKCIEMSHDVFAHKSWICYYTIQIWHIHTFEYFWHYIWYSELQYSWSVYLKINNCVIKNLRALLAMNFFDTDPKMVNNDYLLLPLYARIWSHNST
jgi:hypothetical protein